VFPERTFQAATEPKKPGIAARVGDVLNVRFELLVLGGLFILMGAFGRTFSKAELGFSWLHPTEVALAVVLVSSVVRTPAAEWFARLRSTRVLVPIAVLWFFGAIAALRGLTDWGFSQVLHDIGLVEYSVLVPIVIIAIRDRAEFLWLCGAIALSGLGGMVMYAITLWTPLQWDLANKLNLIAPAIGLYLTIWIAWVLARSVAGVPVRWWQYATVAIGIAFIVVGLARSVWVGCIAALAIVVLCAFPGRRLRFLMIAGLMVVGVALSFPAAKIHFGTAPNTEASGFEAHEKGYGEAGRPDVFSEVSSSFASSSQEANSAWRLAYWKYMVEETAKQPLLGAGFGKPAAFVWQGTPYDTRAGTPGDPFDVIGPHNSFVNTLYRTGVFGLLAIAVLVGLAGFRLISGIRRSTGVDRATFIWLLAALAATIVVASFTVALEGPYMGIYFWGLLGLGLLATRYLGRDDDAAAPASGT
jgi:hypothetical protein